MPRSSGSCESSSAGAQSGPRCPSLRPDPHVNNELPLSARYRAQAEWLTAALRIARRRPRIYALGWLSLYDDPSRPGRRDGHRGLIDLKGARQLAYYASRRG